MENLANIRWEKVNSFIGNATLKSLGFFRLCPICGSLDSKKVLELNNFQFYSDSKETPKCFDVTENMCLKCFTLYLNPCYSNYGFSALFAEAGQSYGSMLAHTHEQIDWLSNYDLLNDGAYVLDVGCYDGSFLSRLPNSVIKLGVDIDEPAIIRGREMHHEKEIQFFHGDFETFLYNIEAPDPMKHGKTWRGIPIYDSSLVNELDWSSTNLLISSYGGQEAIAEAADRFNVSEKNIIRLYNTIRRY